MRKEESLTTEINNNSGDSNSSDNDKPTDQVTTTVSDLEDTIKKVDEMLEEGKLHVNIYEGQRELVDHYVTIEN